MNLDSYTSYADSLAFCGRISEAFEIYNYINNNICGHLPMAGLKNLSKCIIDYVLRLKNDDEFNNIRLILAGEIDPLLCQICSPPDILRCPVTVKCGHTFCRECCDEASKCPICNTQFAAALSMLELSENNKVNTSSSPSLTACAATTTLTFPSTSATSSITSPGPNAPNSFQKASEIESNKQCKNSLMPDILVRQLVEKWWSDELYARNMNDLSMQYLNLNLLDDALKFCNQSLNKFPNNFQSLLLRAEVLYKLHHYQSSLADVNRAIKTSNRISPKAFYQKAQSLAALGKFEESLISMCLVICLDFKLEIFPTQAFEKNLLSIR